MSQLPDPYGPAVPSPYAPAGGYLPPQSAFVQPGGDLYDDPLVAPPNGGVGGWFKRIGSLFQHSWKSTLTILAITQLLPGMVIGVGAIFVGVYVGLEIVNLVPEAGTGTGTGTGEFDFATVLPLIAAVVVVAILLYILQLAGYAAATHSVTRQAAGTPATIGESLGYGFRRSLGLFAWYIPVGLMILVGALACLLPGIYLTAATALVGPIFLFERINPIGRSFKMLHNSGGRVLGRLALIVLITIGLGFAVSIIEAIIEAVVNAVSDQSFGPTVNGVALVTMGAIVSVVLSAVIQLPVTMFQFAGILLTYTEQRGYEGATTPHLNAELH
ncbi:hypothetical protein Cme02nite_35440 [Catellatospora methionotrophica]|uniref:Glycerophosphoryl diester phosphodiesterase membrane domain-containing protein n=1 Tax=Catellatospora methionotrophica TaxID=121620 RepID=A0A8J3PFG6_9ACTN|nr:DUF3824 domain-containing protein [Catellatospora methionotrophica]GIG15212.1 hypothetical protein Cme02nite_35440 [Catellatospora methionotrophica]